MPTICEAIGRTGIIRVETQDIAKYIGEVDTYFVFVCVKSIFFLSKTDTVTKTETYHNVKIFHINQCVFI